MTVARSKHPVAVEVHRCAGDGLDDRPQAFDERHHRYSTSKGRLGTSLGQAWGQGRPDRIDSTSTMHSKPPSSLDYDGHLHELALNNWRRALHERDVSRAEINAHTLTAFSRQILAFRRRSAPRDHAPVRGTRHGRTRRVRGCARAPTRKHASSCPSPRPNPLMCIWKPSRRNKR